MASQYVKLPKVSGGGGGGAVDSFNGRTGPVVSQAGDYSGSIISNTPAGSISATNVQSALNELDTEKQAVISGNDARLIVKNASSVVESNDNFRIGNDGGLEIYTDIEFQDNVGSRTSQYFQTNITADQNSPDEYANIIVNQINLDPGSSGFNLGTNANSVIAYNTNINHGGTSNVGTVNISHQNFSLGNGTDPINVRGFGYQFGFGTVNPNVTINGPMQGYGYQPFIQSGATIDPTQYTQAFYDNSNVQVTAPNHTSFNAGPNIAAIANNNNFTGVSVNPEIDDFEGNSNFTGVAVFGQLGTFTTGNFTGVTVQPNIDLVNYAVGLNVSMDGVTTSPGAKASATIQDIYFETDQPGSQGNSVTITYTGGGTAGSEVVSNIGLAIAVQIEDGVSTATQVKTALDNYLFFSSNLNATITGTASNPQTIQGPTSLTGGIDPGNKKAAYLDGDVEITGGLTFGGALSIGKLNAYATEPLVNGSGSPASIHTLITQPTVADNQTITNADLLGVNTAALITIGSNSSVSTAFLGVSALGLPAVLSMGSGSTIDKVNGAVFALSLDGTSTGGTVDVVSLCSALAIPNGITTVNTVIGYNFDLPFGSIATNSYAFYGAVSGASIYNAGAVVVGSVDTVTNSNVGLEITGNDKALLNARLTTTERDAITAVNGMQIYNTTTDKLQVYAGGSWVDLH